MNTAGPSLDDLLTRLCDGTLTEGERQVLSDRLASDPAARREYLAYVDLHASLLVGLPGAMPIPAAQPSAPEKPPRRAWRVAMLAASVLVVAALAWRFLFVAGDAPVQPFASLGELSVLDGGVEWLSPDGASSTAATGDPLRAGHTLRTSDDGLAELTLRDGTQLELSPGARLRLPPGDGRGARFTLEAGLLQAEAKPRPVDDPLLVVTAQAEVVVLGTKFSVSAAEPGATGVETEAGLVRVRRVTDGQSVEVPAGHFTVASRELPAFDVRRSTELPATPRATFNLYRANGLAFTADGGLTAVSNRVWKRFDMNTGLARYEPQATAQKSEVLVVSSSGSHILTHGRTAPIVLCDADEGRVLQRTKLGTTNRAVWALDRDARIAVFGTNAIEPASRFTLWDPRAARALAEWPLEGGMTAAAVSDDGGIAAIGVSHERTADGVTTQEGRLQLWDLRTRQPVATIEVPGPLRLLNFSRDGTRLAGATRNGGAMVWNVPSRQIIARRDGRVGMTLPVTALSLSADGRRLALGLANGRVRLWDVELDQEIGIMNLGRHSVSALALSQDGRTLASCVLRGSVNLWDLP